MAKIVKRRGSQLETRVRKTSPQEVVRRCPIPVNCKPSNALRITFFTHTRKRYLDSSSNLLGIEQDSNIREKTICLDKSVCFKRYHQLDSYIAISELLASLDVFAYLHDGVSRQIMSMGESKYKDGKKIKRKISNGLHVHLTWIKTFIAADRDSVHQLFQDQMAQYGMEPSDKDLWEVFPDMALIVTLFFTIFPALLFLFVRRREISLTKLPPGSLGIPFIGQSLNLLQAMKVNTAEKWINQRVEKYRPISNSRLFGSPTVFINGQVANKFIFTADGTMISNQQTASIRMILGDRNLLELSGDDHKRVRSALMPFLKPESLKQYIGKMDNEFRNHLQMHWEGKDQITRKMLIPKHFKYQYTGVAKMFCPPPVRREYFQESSDDDVRLHLLRNAA